MKALTRVAVVFLAVFAIAFPPCAEAWEFPPEAEILNVRDARFAAKGDGQTDDTESIQKALTQGAKEQRIVYLPNGTYLVSDTLRWDEGGCDVQGQSREGTILRLVNAAKGFTDERKPKPILSTGGASSGNLLQDFTLETGEGNDGAIGVDFVSPKGGALRRMSLKGSGWCGLRAGGGSGFVAEVDIDEFRHGVLAEGSECQMAFEGIKLTGTRDVGLEVADAVVCFRTLKSSGAKVGVRVRGAALLDLLGAELTAEGSHEQAIVIVGNEPAVYMRDIKTSGYDGIMIARGMLYSLEDIQEWCNGESFGNWGARASAPRLPVEEPPDAPSITSTDWADAGKPDGKDDTARMQAALNAGKAAVLLRHGVYRITDSLRIPASVKLIIGSGAKIETAESFPGDRSIFMFKDGSSNDSTLIERLGFQSRGSFLANHADSRTLVLRDLQLRDTPAYRNREESGKLFVENVSAPIHILHPTNVWIRGYSINGAEGIINNGGTIWALGCSLRLNGTLIENRNGGSIEAWGMLLSAADSANAAAVLNDRATLSLSLAGAPPFYDVLVHDDQSGSTKEYRTEAMTPRGKGGAPIVPLFISSPEPTGERKIE